MRCDLVIPARNEADNLPALAAALRPLLDAGTLRRVVLCDNGSTDDTADLARSAGFTVVHEPQPGYGAACLAALHHIEQNTTDLPGAGALALAFLDADLADDPAMLPALLEPLANGDADLVLARRVPQQRGALDPHQRFGNRLACVLMRLLTGRRYRDLGPMRALTWDALQRLDMTDRTWGWTVEMQYKAATRGLRTLEIDSPYRRRHAARARSAGRSPAASAPAWLSSARSLRCG